MPHKLRFSFGNHSDNKKGGKYKKGKWYKKNKTLR